MRDRFDLSVYGILDPQRSRGRDVATLAADAVRGGATFLQLRDKHGSTRDMVAAARAILAAIDGCSVPLVINDRVDVALASKAHGVHIGEDDMAPGDARALPGADAAYVPKANCLRLLAPANGIEEFLLEQQHES